MGDGAGAILVDDGSPLFDREGMSAMEFPFDLRLIRGARTDDSDGGNALCAALEYWERGIVFNGRRNCVALWKRFPGRPGLRVNPASGAS